MRSASKILALVLMIGVAAFHSAAAQTKPAGHAVHGGVPGAGHAGGGANVGGGGNVINNNFQPPTARSFNVPNNVPNRNVVVPNNVTPKHTEHNFVPRNNPTIQNQLPQNVLNGAKDFKFQAEHHAKPATVTGTQNNSTPSFVQRKFNQLPPSTNILHTKSNAGEKYLKLVPAPNYVNPAVIEKIKAAHAGGPVNDQKSFPNHTYPGQFPTGTANTNFKILHTNKPLPKPLPPPNNPSGNANDNDDDHHHHHHNGYGYGSYNPYYGGSYGYGAYPYYLGNFGNIGFGYNSPYYGYGYGYNSPYYGYGYSRFGVGLSVGGYPSSAYVPTYSFYGSSVPSYSATPSRVVVSRPADVDDVAPRAADGSEPTSHDFAAKGETDFKAGDYKAAVRNWQHALVDEPNNGAYLLLLSQGFFATGEFDAAAGATQQAARNLPAEHWNVVVKNYKELYTNIQDYTDQLRALEKARTEKPDSPGLRFLLGWHYGYLGYPKQAIAELDKLLELVPDDEVGKQLREQFIAQLTMDAVPAAPVEGKKI